MQDLKVPSCSHKVESVLTCAVHIHTQNKSFFLSLKNKEHSHGTVLNQIKKLTLHIQEITSNFQLPN